MVNGIKNVVSAIVFIFLWPLYVLGAMSISANPAGLESLTYNGVEYLARGGRACVVTTLAFQPVNRTMPAIFNPVNSNVSSGANQVVISRTYSWGVLRCTYAVQGNRVRVNVYVVNDTPDTLSNLGVQVIPLISPTGMVTQIPATKFNLEGPEALFIPYGRVKLLVSDEEVAKLLNLGQARFPGGILILFATTIVHTARSSEGGSQRYRVTVRRPIVPRNSDRFSLSLRFAGEGELPKVVLSDLFARWGAAFPPNLNWPDRRPLALLMLASHGRMTPFNPLNPRYWRFVDPKLDITSERGRQQFKVRLFQEADKTIANSKRMNAQGVVVWDVEGQQYTNMNYVGDPRYLPPEMKDVVGEFFRRFTSAGLRCGMTLRGDRVVVPDGNQLSPQSYQSYSEDPDAVFELLDEKVRYAKERFGCSLFYFDSSGTQDWPFDWHVFQRLHAKYPDVLLMPEQKSLLYYTSTAPYCDQRGANRLCPSEEARWLYPKAFSGINLSAADLGAQDQSKLDPFERAMDGDVLMTAAWLPQVDPHMILLMNAQRRASLRWPHDSRPAKPSAVHNDGQGTP